MNKVKVWLGADSIIRDHWYWVVVTDEWSLHKQIHPGEIFVLTAGCTEPSERPVVIQACYTENEVDKADEPEIQAVGRGISMFGRPMSRS